MANFRFETFRSCLTITLTLLAATSFTGAQQSLEFSGVSDVVLKPGHAAAPELTVLHSDPQTLSISVHVGSVAVHPRAAAGEVFAGLTWPEAATAGEIGSPALPVVRQLFIAPPGATVALHAETGNTATIDLKGLGLPPRVWPVQPPIEKVPGARDSAEFILDADVYATDATAPANPAHVEPLGIYRGQNLWLLEVSPVAHNPVAGTLTLCRDIDVSLEFVGSDTPVAAARLTPRLGHMVLNPEILPDGLRETKNYLIVVAPAYEAGVAAFAAAKSAQGFNVMTYVAASPNRDVIKNYIQGLWNTPQAPDYILLVGDTDKIPQWTGGGEGAPDTDLPYSCMDGSGDWYPDITLGRFSVRSPDDLQAMIDKTLYYEQGQLADPGYLKRAVFMASEDNYQVSEGTHNWVINNYMIPNEISYDRLYCHTYNATTQQVRDAFNNGRFWGIYSGHGGNTLWADGPHFSQSDVRGLINENLYAFVCSFACDTGDYAITECFTETWLRVAKKGAITMYGSSVSSFWDEDDVLEKRLFDSIYDLEDEVPSEVGPVWHDALMRYLAQMGGGSTTRRYFEMYNLMGEPSLRFPGACSDAGELTIDADVYSCDDTITISVIDCGLNLDGNVVEQATVTAYSDSEPAGEQVILTETGPGTAEFFGTLDTAASNQPGLLVVADGDVITIEYVDMDNGQHQQVVVTAEADADCAVPSIANVAVSDVSFDRVTVRFDSNEPVKATVHYGTACGQLTQQVSTTGYETSPVIEVTGLAQLTRFYFAVEAADRVGNTTYDDNGGDCYAFKTLHGPEAIYSWNMDTNPQWSTQGQWAWGQPQGQGGDHGSPDPGAGHTGVYVYGYNLAGDYGNSIPEYHLTTTALDFTDVVDVKLRFWRWLGVERNLYDHAYIRVSTNGTQWTQIWANPDEELAGGQWEYQEFDISAYADNHPTVYVRWTMGTSDVGWTYCGWNLDDVELWGIAPEPYALGDLNCDGELDFGDINPFVLALTDPVGYAQVYPDCDRDLADINEDGKVDFGDINPFVDLLTAP